MKNVKRDNNIRVGNGKQRPQPQDYNNFSQQNPNPPPRGNEFKKTKEEVK